MRQQPATMRNTPIQRCNETVSSKKYIAANIPNT